MKFSHTLSLNSNPDWVDHYVDYAGLKKLINELSSQKVEARDVSVAPDEQAVKVDGDMMTVSLKQPRSRDIFLERLEETIASIQEFYDEKHHDMDRGLFLLQSRISKSSSPPLDGNGVAIEMSPLLPYHPRSMRPLSKISHSDLEDMRREICDLFIQYHNLKTYASLNCTAVKKILKKYDKNMMENLTECHLDRLKSMLSFWDGTPELENSIELLKDYFAYYFCNGDSNEAWRRMKLMVREFITFQRHSVWLDVIEDHRRHESAQASAARLNSQDVEGRMSVPQRIKTSTTLRFGMFSIVVFLGFLVIPGIFDEDPIKRNALAMFVFVSLLWAAEVLPLFVTSMLVPFLTVLLRVVVVDGIQLDARASSKHVFNAMFSHVIMLLIGGFSIAAALSKHNIAKVAASSIIQRFGNGIRTVLMVNLFIATIASMWISNVAAPVLCYSLIAPILKTASAEQSRAPFGTSQSKSADQDHRLCRALVMGIALASNVGGMASPISSPQNLFAIEYTPIGWLAWFSVSIPVCIITNLIIWAWLVFCFQLPSANSSAVFWALQRDRSGSETFSAEQYFVMTVSIGVVLLWCASVQMAEVTGQMGVLGIVPFVIFFGTGVLSKEDLNNFLWSVVILAMGGLVFGEAIKSSGLLDVIAEGIAVFIEHHSLGLWETLCIFTLLILFCTTFVSHTVGAIVVLPIAYAVGSRMDPSHSKEMVFAGALACSAAMGLPVSGFPNMTAVSVEDNVGNRFVTTKDFLQIAVPASIFSWIVIVTLGYCLILEAVQIDD